VSPISNAKDILLTANSGTIPNLTGAVEGYFQPMVFKTITKTVVNFQVVETPTIVNSMGTWQPFSAQQLLLKPEGQRVWSWYQLHTDLSTKLNLDDVVIYQGIQYRVMSKLDYSLYGYLEYHLVSDFTGAGP
jgi:hypothetical protein